MLSLSFGLKGDRGTWEGEGEEGEGEMKLSGTIHMRYCSECTDCE